MTEVRRTIKALEWHNRVKGFTCSEGGALSYSIMESRNRVYGVIGEHDGAAEFSSLEEAKGAAQQDYESRILAAIDTPNPAEPVARKLFPVLGSGGAKIDYQLVSDHGSQVTKNHYQTVERLAKRGGLSWAELHAVLHDKKWEKIDDNEAMIACRDLEAKYLAAVAAPPPDARERELVEALKPMVEHLEDYGSDEKLYDDDEPIDRPRDSDAGVLTFGDLRRARDVLARYHKEAK